MPTNLQEVYMRILKDEVKHLATIWLTTDEVDAPVDGVIASMREEKYRVAVVRSGKKSPTDVLLPLLLHNK